MSSNHVSVLLDLPNSNPLFDQAQCFAKAHSLPIVSSVSSLTTPYYLCYEVHGLSLCQVGKKAAGPISASFVKGKNLHRLKHGGGKGQMVAKAVGLNKGVYPDVLDVTAGLGRDAFVLASLGCKVNLFERVPVVEELLRYAISEARDCSDEDVAAAASRMSLQYGNAIDYLRSAEGAVADVIYLDPMYPQQDKTAAVKKEMRAFHDIVGANSDDAELLSAALAKARFRVVVKRPRRGVEIAGPKPSLKLEGKSSRYDIYTLRKLV